MGIKWINVSIAKMILNKLKTVMRNSAILSNLIIKEDKSIQQNTN